MSTGYNAAMPVAYAQPSERAMFIRRTYLHVAGAIAGVVAVDFLLFKMFGTAEILEFFFARGSQWMMLGLMFGFMGASYAAQSFARSRASASTQYLGLALFVVAQAIILLPMLSIAAIYAPQVIATAGVLTLALAGGLTIATFVTRKDFSFLAPIISIAACVMIGLIGLSLFGFVELGMWFSLLGVGIASVAILYSTSNVMNHYSTDMHVAAALDVTSAIGMLFFYILQILLSARR